MIESMITGGRRKAQEAAMRSYYAELGSAKALQPNQKDATPATAKRVPNPHTGKALTKFPRGTEAQAKIATKKAEIIEKRHNNGVQILKAKEKIESIETKEHGMMSEYRIGRLDRELTEQQANAKLAQYASQQIPQYAVMRGETDLVRNEATYDASAVAQEFLVVKGW